MIKFLKWLIFEFLSRVVMEFLWMLFSVALGIYLVSEAAQIPETQLDQIINQYGPWLVMVLFNAAAFRIVLHFGLDWLDKQLDKQAADNREMLDQTRAGIQLAVRLALKRPIITTEPETPDDDRSAE